MANKPEQKWHFTREWTVTYNATSGRTYNDTSHEPLDWDEFMVNQETREKIFVFRIIHTDDYDLKTEHIEGFKLTKGRITKSLYPEIKNIEVTAKDLKEKGFSAKEIKEELARYTK
jgi:hypothetical protein